VLSYQVYMWPSNWPSRAIKWLQYAARQKQPRQLQRHYLARGTKELPWISEISMKMP